MSDDWRPIETAPKDGATVLLWDRDVGHHEIGRWSDRHQCWHQIEWGPDEEPPVDADMIQRTIYLPSHWQPLPQPPD